MIRRPPRSTLFPTRRSSDLVERLDLDLDVPAARLCPDAFDVPGARGARQGLLGVVDVVRAVHYTQQNLTLDRKSTRLNSSHQIISYAVFFLQKKTSDSAHNT